MLMDLWTHSFLKSLRHANHVYWCIYMKKLHAKWTVWTHLIFESLETCKSYHMGKMTESLGFSKMELENNLLEVIHFDVCTPMSGEACSGCRYVFTSQMMLSILT